MFIIPYSIPPGKKDGFEATFGCGRNGVAVVGRLPELNQARHFVTLKMTG